MATSRITIRTIDYHKFRSLVIDRDGVGEELRERCDRDVTALCDAVRRLYERRERFDNDDDDDGSGSRTSRAGRDLARFGEICGWYKLILENRRVRSVDVRLRSCWWEGRNGEKGVSAAAAGRLRSSSLRQTLVDKTAHWLHVHGPGCWRDLPATETDVSRRLDGPGVVVFVHRSRRCLRLVARAANVFSWCSDALRDAFEGSNPDPLSALFVTSVSQDWDFYFIPVLSTDGDRLLRILENDTILRHDSVWPYGLNFRLSVTSFVELTQLRTSCRRHRWPASRDPDLDDDDVTTVQGRLCQRLRLALDGAPDDVISAHNEFDVVQSIPDSPTSTSAMLTFADIVAASTVKNWNDCADRGRCRCAPQDDSSSSSDGSTATGTTVRTVVTKSAVPDTEDFGAKSSTKMPDMTKSAQRSASRPASARVKQLTTGASSRARSVSQSRSTSSASKFVPIAGHRNAESRSPRMNRQSKQ